MDNQKDGYVLKIEKNPDKNYCQGCCISEFAKEQKLRVTDNESHITILPI